jgi:uncharacterized protein (UPF0332 family)
MELDAGTRERIAAYMARAHQAIETGQLVMHHEDYITVVNRAYYAMFYSANAILATKGLERSKHSGVIAAFRQQFVKTGIIELRMSRVYGEALDERHTADYELEPLDFDTASRNLMHAVEFVTQIERYLRETGAI